MSDQAYAGWFPECLVCGTGALGTVVCLDPACHEAHEAKGFLPIEEPLHRLVQVDGHYWRLCQLCDHRILSDGSSWGTYAICVDCFNTFAHAKVLPPATPQSLAQFIQDGVIVWKKDATGSKLTVRNIP